MLTVTKAIDELIKVRILQREKSKKADRVDDAYAVVKAQENLDRALGKPIQRPPTGGV